MFWNTNRTLHNNRFFNHPSCNRCDVSLFPPFLNPSEMFVLLAPRGWTPLRLRAAVRPVANSLAWMWKWSNLTGNMSHIHQAASKTRLISSVDWVIKLRNASDTQKMKKKTIYDIPPHQWCLFVTKKARIILLPGVTSSDVHLTSWRFSKETYIYYSFITFLLEVSLFPIYFWSCV